MGNTLQNCNICNIEEDKSLRKNEGILMAKSYMQNGKLKEDEDFYKVKGFMDFVGAYEPTEQPMNTYSPLQSNAFTSEGNIKQIDLGNGNIYQGELFNGKFHGRGNLIIDEISYLGRFKNGLKTGEGQIYDPKGKLIFKGLFKDNLKEGKGKYNS